VCRGVLLNKDAYISMHSIVVYIIIIPAIPKRQIVQSFWSGIMFLCMDRPMCYECGVISWIIG
jgi:hypothetical protein